GIAAALLSPISWGHHLVWVVPAVVILVDVAFTRGARRPGLRYLLLAAATFVLFTSGVIHHFNRHKGGHHWDGGLVDMIGVNAYMLGCLVLLVLVPYVSRPRAGGRPARVTADEEVVGGARSALLEPQHS